MSRPITPRWIRTLSAAAVSLILTAGAASAETGIASFYGNNDGFHGRTTASGEIYNKMSMTAAHKTLPLNTLVRVTNLSNGRSVVVRINNRGPYVRGRIIDLSVIAAQQLGFAGNGITRVSLDVVQMGDNLRINQKRAASTSPALAGSPYAGRPATWEGGRTVSTTVSMASVPVSTGPLTVVAANGVPVPTPRPAAETAAPARPVVAAAAPRAAARAVDPLDVMLLRERN
jgi:rare lipoprotein A